MIPKLITVNNGKYNDKLWRLNYEKEIEMKSKIKESRKILMLIKEKKGVNPPNL